MPRFVTPIFDHKEKKTEPYSRRCITSFPRTSQTTGMFTYALTGLIPVPFTRHSVKNKLFYISPLNPHFELLGLHSDLIPAFLRFDTEAVGLDSHHVSVFQTEQRMGYSPQERLLSRRSGVSLLVKQSQYPLLLLASSPPIKDMSPYPYGHQHSVSRTYQTKHPSVLSTVAPVLH